MKPRRRGALGGARQGRREPRYAGISGRLRTPHRAAQRGSAAQGFIAREALNGSRSSSSSAHFWNSGSSSRARSSAGPCLIEPAGATVDAREVEEESRVVGLLSQPGFHFGDRSLGILVDDGVGDEEVLPDGDLVHARLPTHREHGGTRLFGARVTLHVRVAQEDCRTRRDVLLLAVEHERRPAGEDHVELLVAEPVLRVLLDDVLTDLGGRVRADPESRDPEVLAHRRPLQCPDRLHRLDLGQARDLVAAHSLLLNSFSTTGSISSSPSTRSSRLAAPAQSSRRS